jgi:hypothetical protein
MVRPPYLKGLEVARNDSLLCVERSLVECTRGELLVCVVLEGLPMDYVNSFWGRHFE